MYKVFLVIILEFVFDVKGKKKSLKIILHNFGLEWIYVTFMYEIYLVRLQVNHETYINILNFFFVDRSPMKS